MQRRRIFDNFLDRVEAEREAQYIRQYAMDSGTLDPQLASHIRMEMRRRLEMGKELDIYEPMRWGVAKVGIAVVAGAGMLMTKGQPVTRSALGALAATTTMSSVIDLMRLYPRLLAGLHGGVDVAIAMNALEKEGNFSWHDRMTSAQAAPAHAR